MPHSKNLFYHLNTSTFEGVSPIGSAYLLKIAYRASVNALKAVDRKATTPFIHALLNSTIHCEGLGEDILQAAFVAVWEASLKLTTFEGVRAEGTRAAYKAVNKAIFAEKRRANMEDISDYENAIEESLLRLGESVITEDIIRTIIYHLPKHANKALHLRALCGLLEGYTPSEIAKREEVSPARVTQILTKCRAILTANGYTSENITKAN